MVLPFLGLYGLDDTKPKMIVPKSIAVNPFDMGPILLDLVGFSRLTRFRPLEVLLTSSCATEVHRRLDGFFCKPKMWAEG